MADMHILTGDAPKWTIAMHFDVPTGNNSVGVSWVNALVNSGVGGNTSLPDGDGTGGTISAAEKTAIEAGTVYEHVASFPIGSHVQTLSQLRAAVRKFYAIEEAGVVARLQKTLRYFGATEARG